MSEIKNTIIDVLEAEAQADQKIEDANRRSKDILLAAATEVADIQAKFEGLTKSSVRDILAEAEKKAQAEYAEVYARGKAEADAFKAEASAKVEKASEYIVEKFIDGVKVRYGNS